MSDRRVMSQYHSFGHNFYLFQAIFAPPSKWRPWYVPRLPHPRYAADRRFTVYEEAKFLTVSMEGCFSRQQTSGIHGSFQFQHVLTTTCQPQSSITITEEKSLRIVAQFCSND